MSLSINDERTCPQRIVDSITKICHAYNAGAGQCANGHAVAEGCWIPLPRIDVRPLIAMCTGTAPDVWVETDGSTLVKREFYNRDDDDQMVLYVSDGRSWYIAINYIMGGCEKRLAHGVHEFDKNWGALRADCENWPVFDARVWRSCCEDASRKPVGEQPEVDGDLPLDIPF